ncbi:right-handed parallel beta-helix repeat-containing protein [bacterium]|nr:right-handed parallel beta-helix repeat-containing protein [bacterium]
MIEKLHSFQENSSLLSVFRKFQLQSLSVSFYAFIILHLFFYLPPVISYAATLQVPEEYPTMQAAVNSSALNDTILVAPGVYIEQVDIHEHRIHLFSNYFFTEDTLDISNTIIVAPDDSSGVHATISIELNGFTILPSPQTNGSVNAINVVEDDFQISNIRIAGTNWLAPAINLDRSEVIIENTSIIESPSGGIHAENGTLTLRNVHLSGWDAGSNEGVHLFRNELIADSCTVAGFNDDGLYSLRSDIEITNSEFTNNVFGLSIIDTDDCYISNCSIMYNRQVGLSMQDTEHTVLENVEIRHNGNLTYNGHGIILAGDFDCSLEFRGVNITHNFSPGLGAGLDVRGDMNLFWSENNNFRSNLYGNRSIEAADLNVRLDRYGHQPILHTTNFDTFSIDTPNDYFYRCEREFDLNYTTAYQSMREGDLYIDPVNGDDGNSGNSQEEALRSIWMAYRISLPTENQQSVFHLLPGIYSRSSNLEELKMYLNKPVHFLGSGQDEVVLDGEGEESSFFISTDVTFDNLTIQNIPDSPSGRYGIISVDSGSVILNRVLVQNCGETHSFIADTEGPISISNCRFEESGSLRFDFANRFDISETTITRGDGIGVFGGARVSLTNVTISHSNDYGIWSRGGIVHLAGTSIHHCRDTGLWITEGNISFDLNNKCSIYSNLGRVRDIQIQDAFLPDIIELDTFSVSNPNSQFVFPVNQLNINSQHALHTIISHNLFISPDGDDRNDGRTVDSPLATISEATARLQRAQPDRMLTITLAPGEYYDSNESQLPISMPRMVTIAGGGDSPADVIFHVEQEETVFLLDGSLTNFENFTIQTDLPLDIAANPIFYLESESESNFKNISMNVRSYRTGIYAYHADIYIDSCDFDGNLGNDETVGFTPLEFYNSKGEIRSSIFKNNFFASRSSGGNLFYDHCLFYENGNSYTDPAPFVSGYGHVTLQNITTYNNQGALASFIHHTNLGMWIINSILWDEVPSIYFRNPDHHSLSFLNSDLMGGLDQQEIQPWFRHDLGNNLDIDPMFMNPGNGNIALQEGSPCIDAGVSFFRHFGDTLINLPPDRYSGMAPDMGYLESNYSNVTEQENEIPLEFGITGIYPNPFNSQTQLNFTLPFESDVKIIITDILGREVAILENPTLAAGSHTIILNSELFSFSTYP